MTVYEKNVQRIADVCTVVTQMINTEKWGMAFYWATVLERLVQQYENMPVSEAQKIEIVADRLLDRGVL